MKGNTIKYRRAINFDLDTKALKKHYPMSKGWRKAYKDIENCLLMNGFNHRQWSGYISKEPLSEYEMTSLVKKINNSFVWLKNCVKRFDVTIADEKYDYLGYFKNDEDKDLLKDEYIINCKSTVEDFSINKDDAHLIRQTSSQMSDETNICVFDNIIQFDDYDDYEDEYSRGR